MKGYELRLMAEGLSMILHEKLSSHKSFGRWMFELKDSFTVMSRRGVSVKYKLDLDADIDELCREAREAIDLSVSKLSEWPNLLTRQ